MHVLQWIAVEADDKEDALSTARNMLENIMGDEGSGSTWYDWFVAGGGRWNVSEDEDWKSGYDEKTNMIIQGREAIKTKVAELIEARKAHFQEYRDSFEKDGIDINAKLDSYTGVMQYDFELYPLKKMIDMLQGEWDYNACYYDIEAWSTNPKHMLDKLENDDENIFLVPIDFHF